MTNLDLDLFLNSFADCPLLSPLSHVGEHWEGVKSAVSECVFFQFRSWGVSDGEISCDENNGT